MFGKAEWFSESSSSLLPKPQRWQGWAFYLICFVGVLVPATVLAIRGQYPEAGIWIALACLGMAFETRSIRRDMAERKAVANLYVIDDTTQPTVDTPQYELQLKRQNP